MKKYVLDKSIKLRGWKLLPYAFVNVDNNEVVFLNKEAFNTLQLCNGLIDLDNSIFNKDTRRLLLNLSDNGIIKEVLNGETIEPWQEYKYFDNRYIKSAHFSITGRCNCKCKHCYMSANENKYGELSKEEIFKIIDQLHDCGIYNVNLTGGECLVRSDFFEIVDKLIDCHINIKTIYTNGILVTQSLLDEFKKRNIYPRFDMSFDGTEGWHNWLRGLDFAFEKVDNAFKLCRDNGFVTSSEMCLHNGNKHLLRDSINYLASAGCKSIKTNPISNSGEWAKNNNGKSIELNDLYQVYLDYIPYYFKDKPDIDVQLGGFVYFKRNNLNKYHLHSLKPCLDPSINVPCSHARSELYISPEGRALPCMGLTGLEIQNNYPLINEIGLNKCLNDSTYIKLITTVAKEVLDHNDKCKDCKYKSYCLGGCRASALEFHPNDIMAVDEAVCTLFKDNWFKKIDETIKKSNPNCICGDYEKYKIVI